ncbi:MAG: citrate/2-methylcitrate synthase [Bacillales bacterium]|jgi:citrate synthase|nr:citrate/2-methylcitrate synthase [Bacillales bacterium]
MGTLQELANLTKKINNIDYTRYDEHDIKYGLRNKNNTGVFVGVTKVGSVKGYVMDDGMKVPVGGTLLYRNIEINNIVREVEKTGGHYFERVVYLLFFGKLPNETEFDSFIKLLNEYKAMPIDYNSHQKAKHSIMNALQNGVNQLYTIDETADEITVDNIVKQSLIILAQMPDIMLQAYLGDDYNFEKSEQLKQKGVSTAEYILAMLKEDYLPQEVQILDLSLVLHAEHGGGNNSTFTVRVTSSAYTDTYSAIVSGLCSLKGLRHGGANIQVTRMIEDIMEAVDYNDTSELKEYLARILRKEGFDQTGLIYGMGHAVYTVSDPRCIILKEKARELTKMKEQSELYELYDNIESLTKLLMQEKNGIDFYMCANVDLYSGLNYQMMDIDQKLFTPLFALSRVSGWCAHRLEQVITDKKIMRPAYVTSRN